ncbi:MAG: trypsin-like peptidase domain-containing protein [Candidatus Beckwithbacteria bacterium]|nr:trypsin-like peptidase domain-containing protein [Patescibacteria group bacterium]
MKKGLIGLALVVVLVVGILGGAVGDRFFSKKDKAEPKQQQVYREILKEENAVIDVVEKVGPSVVTVGVKKTQKIIDPSTFFDPFGIFNQNPKVEERKIEQDIGSGFIIDKSGLVVTNKHVVFDPDAEFRVITSDNVELVVEKIYRDPSNDLAILKVTPGEAELVAAKMGDSDSLKVGQIVIAIGTALGEFRSTVTTGVISGLGRGINTGYGSLSERLDDVIQTDAAINLGNSGGPLLNSFGQVIGVNVAISQAGENIGFAIPINVVQDSIDIFNATGKFSRPYLGVRYQMLDKKTAILNSVPEGAYIVEIVLGSPADKSGLKENDIVTKIEGQPLTQKNDLSTVVAKLRPNFKIKLEVFRNGKMIELEAVLEEADDL